jgi:hypothetical protein
MKHTDPEFWEELTKGQSQDSQLPNTSAKTFPEDNEHDTHLEDVVADDSELPMSILIAAMTGSELPENVGVGESGGLVSLAEAEDIDVEQEFASAEADQPNSDERHDEDPKEEGRGKRRKTTNKYYSSVAFWWHNDKDDWKDDSLVPTNV